MPTTDPSNVLDALHECSRRLRRTRATYRADLNSRAELLDEGQKAGYTRSRLAHAAGMTHQRVSQVLDAGERAGTD